MSKREKPWERKKYLGRKGKERTIRKILILCEGKNTEPCYFESFPIDKNELEIEVLGLGRNTDSLVEYAIEKKQEALNKGNRYYKIWCVFDRDSFSPQNYNRAFEIVKKHNDIKIAYSNQAFEVWYWLHFDYCDSDISRDQYQVKLDELLPFKYEKTSECSKKMYRELENKQSKAIQNAKTLFNKYKDIREARNNPSTTVYELVEELNERLQTSEK
jgi:homoserine dehydrogenase